MQDIRKLHLTVEIVSCTLEVITLEAVPIQLPLPRHAKTETSAASESSPYVTTSYLPLFFMSALPEHLLLLSTPTQICRPNPNTAHHAPRKSPKTYTTSENR